MSKGYLLLASKSFLKLQLLVKNYMLLYTVMSNCPIQVTARSASGTVIPTSRTPIPSPIPTPTPSYTTTTRVESYIPTEPTLSTDPQTPGFVQNTSTGLIVGIVIPVFAVGLTVFLVIVITFIWTAKKRRIQQTHASKWYI